MKGMGGWWIGFDWDCVFICNLVNVCCNFVDVFCDINWCFQVFLVLFECNCVVGWIDYDYVGFDCVDYYVVYCDFYCLLMMLLFDLWIVFGLFYVVF